MAFDSNVNDSGQFSRGDRTYDEGSIASFLWEIERPDGSMVDLSGEQFRTESSGQYNLGASEPGGTWQVTLTVEDNDGNVDSIRKSFRFTASASNEAPLAGFTYSPESPNSNNTISYDANPTTNPVQGDRGDKSFDTDGSISEFRWRVYRPDGNFLQISQDDSSGETGSFNPNEAGDWSIELTVEDNDGATDTYSELVTVGSANGAPNAVDDGNEEFGICNGTTNVDIDVLNNDTDPDGDAISIDTYDSTTTQGGSVVKKTLSDGTEVLRYSPPAGASSSDPDDKFSYRIVDALGAASPTSAEVTVDFATGCGSVSVNFNGADINDSGSAADDLSTAETNLSYGDSQVGTTTGQKITYNLALTDQAKLASLLKNPETAGSEFAIATPDGYAPVTGNTIKDKKTELTDLLGSGPIESGGGDLTGNNYDALLGADYTTADTCTPLLAEFSYGAAEYERSVDFDAGGSEGSGLTYSWNFGDGSTATGQSPTHMYDNDGNYQVELTVTDADGATDTASGSVPMDYGFVRVASTQDNVTYCEPGESESAKTLTNEQIYNANGSAEKVSVRYKSTASFKNCTQTDSCIQDGSASSDLEASGFGQTVSYSNSVTGPDNTQPTDEETFIYDTSPTGEVEVLSASASCISRDDDDPDTTHAPSSASYGVYVEEWKYKPQSNTGSFAGSDNCSTNQAPNADFTFSTNDLTASFTNQSSDPDGDALSYSWSFGDGGSSVAENPPSHTYSAAGTYTVELTVEDNAGATDSISQDVSVSAGAETLSCNVYYENPDTGVCQVDPIAGSDTPCACYVSRDDGTADSCTSDLGGTYTVDQPGSTQGTCTLP